MKDLTEEAIKSYSKKVYSTVWENDVEFIVLDLIKNNKQNIFDHFTEKQISAMRDLIREGYWVKYQDISLSEGEIVLYKMED